MIGVAYVVVAGVGVRVIVGGVAVVYAVDVGVCVDIGVGVRVDSAVTCSGFVAGVVVCVMYVVVVGVL